VVDPPDTFARYLRLVRALTDPADPDHDDAVEWLGENYDPARYQPR